MDIANAGHFCKCKGIDGEFDMTARATKTKATVAEPQLSAAERYEALKDAEFEKWLDSTFTAEALKDVELFDVETPSGMIFKCRRAVPEIYLRRNVNPVFFRGAVKQKAEALLASATNPKAAEKVFLEATPEEQMKWLHLLGDVVRYICVSPRILSRRPEADELDAIFGSEMSVEDINALAAWTQAGGGDSGESLRSFRRKRR